MAQARIDPAKSDAILQRLTALHPKSIDLSLDRMWGLLARLGQPHHRLPPVIHVAGTNGKGSTIAYMRAILEAAGRRVHVYTSPHLVRFAERVRLCGETIDEDYWADVLARAEALNGAAPITFFEVTTAAAFLAYAEVAADYLLLETGLGGRLDATNVIDRPQLTAITPISIDHTQFLGPTVEGIAAEKAGILRPGVDCVVGRQDPAPAAVLARQAAEIGAPLYRHDTDWRVAADGPHLVWRDGAKSPIRPLVMPRPGLAGPHQIDNAGLAIAALKRLADPAVDDRAIADGLGRVDWPGRLQRLTSGPLPALAPDGAEIWLDGGHNPAAGAAVAAAMRDFAARDPLDRPLRLVIGMLNTKDPAGYLAPFAGVADGIQAVTIPDQPATLSAEEIAAAGEAIGLDVRPATGLIAAITRLRADSADGPPPRVLICGSLYLAGAVLAENA